MGSLDDPADCASRGISSASLKGFKLWWHGPRWLRCARSEWPSQSDIPSSTNLEARKNTQCLVIAHEDLIDWTNWYSKYSSLHKIVRIFAYIYRWRANAKLTLKATNNSWLSAQEIHHGRILLWRVVQRGSFAEDYSALSKEGVVKNSSSLRRLLPFIGSDGLIRVSGRLQNSSLSESEKHPIILPPKNHVTRLLIRDTHLHSLHGGPLLVQSILSRQFWIVRGRNAIRVVTRNCVKCTRHKGTTLEQQMGPLPVMRTQPARPFR